MRLLIVAGARPNFMKVAPLMRAFRKAGHEALLVHTGQHYDATMSDTFFQELEIPAPDFHLDVGSGSHAVQTARVMERFEPVLMTTRPDWVVVVGDVNSTLACALVASKLKETLHCRVAHVEAGLRSGDWRMPEEVNRVLTDRLSDVLLTPSLDARHNLATEGIMGDKIEFVGNIMVDTLVQQFSAARALGLAGRYGYGPKQYAVATLHRPSNVDSPAQLSVLLTALERVSRIWPVLMPVHPRTRKRIEESNLSRLLRNVRLIEPLGYREMLSLTSGAAVVMTDSGGLQEETTVLGIPCVTLREQTERPITITEGTNRLPPYPFTMTGIVETVLQVVQEFASNAQPPRPEGWDGRTAQRIVSVLERRTAQHMPALPLAV